MFEILEHEADVGVRASGATWEEAFEDGAIGMLSVMADEKTVEAKDEMIIEVSANDMAALFVEFLNELLYIRDAEEMFVSKFEIKIKENVLIGKICGEKINQEKHRVKIEVKAATYSGLKVWEKDGKKFVQCVLDV